MLEYWIREVGKGAKVEVEAEAVKERIDRYVELWRAEGYELYRVFKIKYKDKEIIIKKPSISLTGLGLQLSGFADDPENIKKENIDIANMRYQRDINRLKEAGIEIKIKNFFDYTMF